MATISGTSGNDSLTGTPQDDTINGQAGADTLSGGNGADSLIGGGTGFVSTDSADYVTFGSSPGPVTVDFATTGQPATISGTAQDGFGSTDTISGITGVIGSTFADRIDAGGLGRTTHFAFDGGAGADTLIGGQGSDQLVGGPGNDTLTGNEVPVNGIDIADFDAADYRTSPAGVSVDLGTGVAQDGFGSTDTLTDIEIVLGSPFADSIIGTADLFQFFKGGDGNDTILAGGDRDTIAPGQGSDSIDGGDGLDTLLYSPEFGPDSILVESHPRGVTIDLALGTAQDGTGDVDTLSGFEIVVGSRFSDSITGDAQDNSISGGQGGNDTLSGNDGADTLAADSNSLLRGGDGNDVLTGGSNSTLEGGAGDDTFNPSAPTAVLRGGPGTDTLTGGIYDYADSPAPVNVDVFVSTGPSVTQIGSAQDGFGSVDVLKTSPSARVNGSTFADTIVGGNGSDTLDGGDGADMIDGDAFFDVLRGGNGNDTLTGGSEADRIDFTTSPAAVMVDLSAGTAQDGFGSTDTFSGIEGVNGSAFNDTLIGSNADNFLSGLFGDDLLQGGPGNDTLAGGVANGDGLDTADYGASPAAVTINLQTTLFAGVVIQGQAQDGFGGTDTLFALERAIGSAFADGIIGSGIADTLDGGDGNDTLTGANGSDSLVGGTGNDTAIFSGLRAAYTVTFGAVGAAAPGPGGNDGLALDLSAGRATVVGADGSDTLSGVEFLQFDDQTIAAPVTISIAPAAATEGNGASANLLFTISLSGPSVGPVTVTATTSNGTATAGSDYTAKSQAVTIPGGQTSAVFTVAVTGDTLFEPDETLTVTLSNPNGATLGAQSVATGTIVNDDAAPVTPVASIANASIVEGEGGTANLVFTVSLSAASAQEVTVQASTQDEIARTGSDYTATVSTVTIAAGQTSASFSVPIIGDTAIEIDESFAVVLSSPTGGAVISATAGAARGFIHNDDLTPTIVVNGQTLNGTGGDDFLVASALNDSVRGEGGADTEFGNEQSDILLGGAGNDFILGDFPGNFLDGSADFIDAGDGNDNVFGGGGDDTVFGGPGDDLIGGDFGDNLIFGGDGNNALIGFGGADTIEGGNDGDIVFGLSGPDVISTKGGFDLIIAGGDGDGSTDADFIDVADGGSSVFAGSGDDTILAGEGADFMLGESGADVMRAGGGVDIVIAGPGNDTLDGGAGNDVIIPEGGDDLIAGGAGADLFRYPAGIAVNADRITDFAPADDTVELGAALGFANGTAALAAVTQVGADAVLTLPNAAGTIAFAGVQASALTAADFVIV